MEVPVDVQLLIWQLVGGTPFPDQLRCVCRAWRDMVTPMFLARYFAMRVPLPVPDRYLPYARHVSGTVSEVARSLGRFDTVELTEWVSGETARTLSLLTRARLVRLDVYVGDTTYALPATSVFCTGPTILTSPVLKWFTGVAPLSCAAALTLLQCPLTHMDAIVIPDASFPKVAQALGRVASNFVELTEATPAALTTLRAAIPSWSTREWCVPRCDDASMASLVQCVPPSLVTLHLVGAGILTKTVLEGVILDVIFD